MELWQFVGDLHPKLVHFPLVLLLAGLLFDLGGLVFRSERAHWAAKPTTAAGTVLLLFTFISGIYAEVWAGRAMVPHHQIELHEIVANVASWGFVILAAWRLLLRSQRRRAMLVYTVTGLAWYGLLFLTAQLGGKLIMEYGAGVTGARALTAPSLHDLNTLAQRQTDENLLYSEWMHHIFGYMTLGLAGSLLVAALLPRHASKLKWVGPTLLLLGGIFLFFFADLDLYRFTDPRQWRDREVQLHKTLAVILTIVGAIGLRSTFKKMPASEQVEPIEATPASAWARNQSKLIAIMSLIGGGMLFTHVHTVAPYANVAAGVYIAHVVMGIVALAIGGSRLLMDALPRQRRFFATSFALLMLTMSILLITYNEGLPWYVGYGTYNRWGARGGTVAPYGPIRAELTYDDKTQRVDVYVMDRHKDTPVTVDAQRLDLLIARGYQETAVGLARGSASNHFTAHAPFLKSVHAFSARLALPIGPTGQMKMGYFDPWVTPLIKAVPPNEVALFVCPMHEGIRATASGDCTLCGMALAAIDRKPRIGLHDPQYDMMVSAPPQGKSPLAVTLQLTPQRDGAVLRELSVVHEYPLHLIVVSQDLAFFDHVHPVEQADGTFTLPYKFPAEGRYLLFADITPKGDRSQVFRLPIQVGNVIGDPPTPRLTVSPGHATTLRDDPAVTVSMNPTPRKLTVGTHAQLLFAVAENGRPVTDLKPYLEAMGHCVVISEDTQMYLHSHPEQLLTPKPDEVGGPEVPFHLRFDKPGRYKVWGQFQRGSRMLIADFVVDVGNPILPPSIMQILFDD